MQILFFGSLGERLGRATEMELLSGGCTIADIRQALIGQNPEAAAYLAESAARAAVNQALVPENFPVSPGEEVAFFPVLSGG